MRIRLLMVLGILLLFVSTSALAQATRTWVSGVGDDTNPCSYTAPCKTFSGAYNKTASRGIISVKDPGSYGGLTISKPITIDAGDNYASVLHTSGDGIYLNFTTTDPFGNAVVLRGISFESTGSGYGVYVAGSAQTHLLIDDCTFTREGAAVGMTPGGAGSSLQMTNVDIKKMGYAGFVIDPPSGTAMKLEMKNVNANHTSTYGAIIYGPTNGTIRDSSFADATHGLSIEETTVHLALSNVVLSNHTTTGLKHTVAGITTLLDHCSIFSNGTGISNTGSNVFGYGNNSIGYNGNDVIGNAIQTLTQP